MDKQTEEIEGQLRDLLLNIPNIPHDSVPIGDDERGTARLAQYCKAF